MIKQTSKVINSIFFLRAVKTVSFMLFQMFENDGSSNLFYTHRGSIMFVLLVVPDRPVSKACLHNNLLLLFWQVVYG